MRELKLIYIAIIFLLASGSCYTQNAFRLNSAFGFQTVLINGKEYQLNSIGSWIGTNYPKFDTLVFSSAASNINIPIICNFKPDISYSLSGSCCGSFDIFLTSELDNDSFPVWEQKKDFEKFQSHLMDRPNISIKTKNNPKDSIYSWHADASCKTDHKVINTELWRLGVPPKCYYWNNITTIVFFKIDGNIWPVH